MNYKKIIISFIALLSILSACNKDLLDKYPLDSVTSAVFFTTPNDMKIYMNQYYNRNNFPVVWHNYGSDIGTDIYVTDAGLSNRFLGTRTISDAPSYNYSEVRSVNYFFANYKKCEDDFDKYKQYVGEAHFFRAMFYYNLLRTFGDVSWVTNYLETDSPELFEPRTPRNIVVDNIIAQLDSAAMYLSADKTNGNSRLNKWIALLFQSRVALYEGTWEKYHAGSVFGVSGAQPETYFNKVVEATTAIMNSGLYDIYSTGSPTVDYVDLFGLRDYKSNPEVMFWVKMNIALGISAHSKQYELAYPNGYGFTRSMADSYLCADGQPISTSPLFVGHNSLNDEKQNRDPRFYQTIFTPDSPWMIDKSNDTTYWEEVYLNLFSNTTFSTPTGYVRRKDGNPYTIYRVLATDESPSIVYRYAEVLLNYVEAKAELGTISQSDIDKSIKKLRNRVGMPNLNIANITPDTNWEFPDLSPVINEIRRERKIELALERFRWDDIARWAAADELIVGRRPTGSKVSQYAIKPTSFPIDENGYLDPFKNMIPNGYSFVLGRDYLSPLSEHELSLNPNLGQNPGW